MSKRDARALVAFGKQGSGKTEATKLEGICYQQKFRRTILIVDVKDEYKKYKAIYYNAREKDMHRRAMGRGDSDGLGLAGLHLPRIYRIVCRHTDGMAMNQKENVELMLTISKYYKNGMLIIEEMNSIIRRSVPPEFYSFITTLRHNGVDVIFHFQSFGDPHPDIISQCTIFRLHKCNDTLESIRGKRGMSPERYEIARIAEMAINENYQQGILLEGEAIKKYGREDNFPPAVRREINRLKYYMLYVDFDYSLIRGIDPETFKKHATNYLYTENPRLIVNLMRMPDPVNGGKLYKTEQDAVNKRVNDMLMVYVR